MTVQEYIDSIPKDRVVYFQKLRKVIIENIPKGFKEVINYGMIGYVVPHSIYPAGYHCSPKDPLPFINIASQKNSITFYHLGLYSSQELLNWFVTEYGKIAKHKIDKGKSCIRFKYFDEIPYDLIGELVRKINVKEWINLYENTRKK